MDIGKLFENFISLLFFYFTRLNDFIKLQQTLEQFIVLLIPENQELKWLSAATYKIALKFYQKKKYDITLESLSLAVTSLQVLFAQEGELTLISKHLKEVWYFLFVLISMKLISNLLCNYDSIIKNDDFL